MCLANTNPQNLPSSHPHWQPQMQLSPACVPYITRSVAFPSAIRPGEAIWAKACYTLICQHGPETGDTFLTRKPTDCNNSLSPTAPQSLRSRQQTQTLCLPFQAGNQAPELDFDISGPKPQETATMIPPCIHFRYMGGWHFGEIVKTVQMCMHTQMLESVGMNLKVKLKPPSWNEL